VKDHRLTVLAAVPRCLSWLHRLLLPTEAIRYCVGIFRFKHFNIFFILAVSLLIRLLPIRGRSMWIFPCFSHPRTLVLFTYTGENQGSTDGGIFLIGIFVALYVFLLR